MYLPPATDSNPEGESKIENSRDRFATIADAVLELNRCLEADSRVVPESLLGGRAA